MNKSESIAELSKAMASFQRDVKQPLKDADNPFFKSKFVPLESVVEAITDIAPKHGLSFTQWALSGDDGTLGVATLLMHTSGEFIEYDPVFMKADKPNAQGAGALITYLKRYTLSAIFGITSDQDDDGNSASGNQAKPITQKQVGELKAASMKFASLRDGTVEQVYQNLNFTDITKLTESQAKANITKVKAWIAKAEKEESK